MTNPLADALRKVEKLFDKKVEFDRASVDEHFLLDEIKEALTEYDARQSEQSELACWKDDAVLESILAEYLAGCYTPDGKLPGMILTSEAKDMALECMRRAVERNK